MALYFVLQRRLRKCGYDLYMPSQDNVFEVVHFSDHTYRFETIKEVEAFYIGLCESKYEPLGDQG